MSERGVVVWGVVYAAGYGRRFGGYKQFERLTGEERLVDRCVRVARAVCDGVVVVLPPGFAWDGPPVERAVPGGETNPDSVRAGVAAALAEAEIILLHSPSHPLVTVWRRWPRSSQVGLQRKDRAQDEVQVLTR